MLYPLVNIQKAIENDHRNSGFPNENGDFHSYVSLPEDIHLINLDYTLIDR